jgi:hypothetical protein
MHTAASEMQLLEDSIRKFKAELKTLTGADSNSTARRKKFRAVWEETKEAAKKTVDTELLKEMGLEDWATGRKRPTSSMQDAADWNKP